MSAYHLYGNRVIPWKIQMEQFISMEFFLKKKQGRYYHFPVLPKWPELSVPFVWITCARLHVERNRKIYGYFVTDTTQSHSDFRGKKITVQVPFNRKFS